MSNHIHFLIQVPNREAFANAMRMLAGQIAIKLGRGKLWMQRIWSRIVKRGRDENGSIAYIFNNPMKAGILALQDCFYIIDGILWGS